MHFTPFQLRRATVLAGFVGALFVMTSLMGRELFPQIDSGQVTIYFRMPTGTRIERTEEKIMETLALAESEGIVVQNLIRLYRSLGGGWDPELQSSVDTSDQ